MQAVSFILPQKPSRLGFASQSLRLETVNCEPARRLCIFNQLQHTPRAHSSSYLPHLGSRDPSAHFVKSPMSLPSLFSNAQPATSSHFLYVQSQESFASTILSSARGGCGRGWRRWRGGGAKPSSRIQGMKGRALLHSSFCIPSHPTRSTTTRSSERGKDRATISALLEHQPRSSKQSFIRNPSVGRMKPHLAPYSPHPTQQNPTLPPLHPPSHRPITAGQEPRFRCEPATHTVLIVSVHI